MPGHSIAQNSAPPLHLVYQDGVAVVASVLLVRLHHDVTGEAL